MDIDVVVLGRARAVALLIPVVVILAISNVRHRIPRRSREPRQTVASIKINPMW